MTKLTQERESPLYLALAGLVSARSIIFLTPVLGHVWTVSPTRDFVLGDGLVGIIYGVTLVAYFVLRKRLRSAWRIFLLIVTSVCAYPAAWYVTVWLYEVYPWKTPSDFGSAKLDIPIPVFFGGGFLGAFLVLEAALLILRPTISQWRLRKGVLAGAFAGGLLAMLGWGLGSMLAGGADIQVPTFFLYVTWQPGVALVLGLLLRLEDSRAVSGLSADNTTMAEASGRRSRFPAYVVLLFGVAAVLLGWRIANVVTATRTQTHTKQAYQECLSAAPSAKDLPPLVPMKIEDALILEPIDDLFPQHPTTIRNYGGNVPLGSAASIFFDVLYVGSTSATGGAEVRQLPNEAWAKYSAEYPSCNLYMFGKQRRLITQFGSHVYRDESMFHSPGGTLFFLWPSSNSLISVRFDKPGVHEEFIDWEILRRYLEKYPSAL